MILTGNSTNQTEITEALGNYISSIVNTTNISNPDVTLTLTQIDNVVSNLTENSLNFNTSTALVLTTNPVQDERIILGASFRTGIGGNYVDNFNKPQIINSAISSAVIFNNDSLINASTLAIAVISDTTVYANVDNSSNQQLVSQLIVTELRTRSEIESYNTNISVSLYFQIISQANVAQDPEFTCVFYDTTTLRWNSSGCTVPTFNPAFNRFECSCNHLTSFGLVWSPRSIRSSSESLDPPVLNAKDIGSLVCQSISIVAFTMVIIHYIVMVHQKPNDFSSPKNILPLAAFGATILLFIFFIATSLTVFTRYQNKNQGTSSSSSRTISSRASSFDPTVCLSSESQLALTVYFFLILMFSFKTLAGHATYRYFIKRDFRMSKKKIIINIAICISIPIVHVIFAAGFHSNPTLKILIISAKKLCWFSPVVIHYFLTIPISIFLLINICFVIFVTKRIYHYVRMTKNRTDDQVVRIKRFTIIIVSSLFTQGIGWLFGPLINVLHPNIAEPFEWIFILFNALEGLWAIIFHILICREGLNNRIGGNDMKPTSIPQSRHKPFDDAKAGPKREEFFDLHSIKQVDYDDHEIEDDEEYYYSYRSNR